MNRRQFLKQLAAAGTLALVDVPFRMPEPERPIDLLIKELTRQSKSKPMTEPGLVISVDDAYRTFAKQLNKPVKRLTRKQKQQAFFNAVIDHYKGQLV